MQSTKKAPLRKEDGTVAAGDDAATIAQSAAGPNTTQPVRYTPSVCGSELVFFLDFLSLTVPAPTLLLFSNYLLLSVLLPFVSFVPSHHPTYTAFILSHLILKMWICPTTSLLRTVSLNFACVAGLLKGRGRWGPSDKRGQQREQGKKRFIQTEKAVWEPGTYFHSAFWEIVCGLVLSIGVLYDSYICNT